jgi:glycosyltransferase involved in cell wall biosynthesis
MWPTAEAPGSGTFVRTQVASLRRAGVDVDVCVVEPRPGPRLVRGVRKYAAALAPLRRQAARADVVHAHYCYPGLLSLLQRSAPVVVTYHGDDALGTVVPGGRTSPTSRWVIVPTSRLLARYVAAVIVQTDAMYRALRRRDALVIPCEVDFDIFEPGDRAVARHKLGLDPHTPYLLFAADPSIPVKNFPLARQVADAVRRELPSSELLVVHGEPQTRLATFMQAVDVLVFPSYQEGSPNIVKQALACNLPVVAADVGDVRAVIGDARHCHVGRRDVDELSDAALVALRAGERTDGVARVERFAPTRVAEQLLAVYRAATGIPTRYGSGP